MNIANLRREYTQKSLDFNLIASNPLDQFKKWLHEAIESQVAEPTAMNLATAVNNRPSSRIVLLKGVEHEGFVFYTNYKSSKGEAIAENPYVALNFFWPELERQVRIEGKATKIDRQESVEYFQSRPRESQIGAWASPQSQSIPNREALEKAVEEFQAKFAQLEKLPCPEDWGGYCVDPDFLEFWQGRSNRLHDRIIYKRKIDNGEWEKERLAP